MDQGKPARAVRVAFWLGFRLASRGEIGPATGWFARGQRLLDSVPADCVERGYLLVPCVEQQLAEGDWDGAFDTATGAAAIGRCFQDSDLVACALHLQGRALIQKGDINAGLTLLDEAMVAVVADELSPLMTGLIYCSVIMACQEVYALGRAQQWTSALARWCDAQPQIVAFTGACLVHRAEILQLGGAWGDAIDEAGRACERFRAGIDPQPPAPAFYQRAEMHRLRGAFPRPRRTIGAPASSAMSHSQASPCCGSPRDARPPRPPGYAGCSAARPRIRSVARGFCRHKSRSRSPREKPRKRTDACRELERIAAAIGRGVPAAIAAQARGAILLAEGDAAAALVSLRGALRNLAGDRGAIRDSARPGPDWTCLRGACRCGRAPNSTSLPRGQPSLISAPSRTSLGSMPSPPARTGAVPTV